MEDDSEKIRMMGISENDHRENGADDDSHVAEDALSNIIEHVNDKGIKTTVENDPVSACNSAANDSSNTGPNIYAKHSGPPVTDSRKQVRVSLHVSPVSVMQSNTQFLNKSRTFFNYITEKSTNMMEKALIPQQLAVRCNTLLRTMDNTYAANSRLKYAEKDAASCGSAELITDVSQRQSADMNGGSFDKPIAKNGSDVVPFHVKNRNQSEVEDCQVSPQCGNDDNGIAAVHVAEKNSGRIEHTSFNLFKSADAASQEHLNFTEYKQQAAIHDCGTTVGIRFEHLQRVISKLSSDLQCSLAAQAALKEECTVANKERESMVMKYAVSEKRLIDVQRALELAERKIEEITKEHDTMQCKMIQAQNERVRVRGILEEKCREENDLEREVEKLKEEVNLKEVKLKWAQNKLKLEMDLRKESQQRLEKALAKTHEMKEECERVRRDTQETIREFQRSQESETVTLSQQLKEQQAQLILERHVTEDKETSRLRLQKQVESLESRQCLLVEENNLLTLKIQDSEKNLLNCEKNLADLKTLADQRQKENAELRGRISELEVAELRLQHQLQRLESCEAEVEGLRRTNVEMQADMGACRQREADMLNFTQKLTDKNVKLQSEFNAVESRSKRLEAEQGPLRERINELSVKVRSLNQELAREKQKRKEECELLAKHLAEHSRLAEKRARELEDCLGENAVLKRKHQASLKEMARELQHCRKRLAETSTVLAPIDASNAPVRAGTKLTTSDVISDVAISSTDIVGDKQGLIDRIVKLQAVNVKRAEKLDFYEEHTRTLVEELQKKTRIIQNYVLRENTEAMGTNERDRHKRVRSKRNPADLARYGGIMASVYNQRVSDDGMTLELSLEMNKKLQAVLEDALLKNITLKDNIDTLGEEIARLTMQNQSKR